MDITKIISIADYAKSVQAHTCDLITNGPNNNWLSFLDKESNKIASLPTGGNSQDCKSILDFSVLVFEDGGMCATANNYKVADSINFA